MRVMAQIIPLYLQDTTTTPYVYTQQIQQRFKLVNLQIAWTPMNAPALNAAHNGATSLELTA
jgi:hypothetical protein